MPSPRHDAINAHFTGQPRVVADAMRNFLGIELPADLPVSVENSQFNDRLSTDFSPDGAFILGPPKNPVRGVVVEVQLSRDYTRKRRQIPRYAAMAWLAMRCPITVLVVCPTNAIGDAFRDRILTNLDGYSFQATVLSPKEIPVLTDPNEITTSPGLAALKMMAHGHITEVTEIFVKGLESLPPDYAMKYYGHVQRMTADRGREKLEELVKKTTVYSDLVREHQAIGEARGEARGEAKALLLTLSARGIEVPEDARTRITGCEDLGQLETWVRRAATAESAEDLFL